MRTRCSVERLLLADRRARGVEFVHRGTREVAEASREVLVCAGAIGSPELLLRSGIGPSHELRRLGIDVAVDAPRVGKGLEDHLCTGFAVGVREPVTLGAAQGPRALLAYLRRRRGLLTSNVCEGYGFIRSDPALAHCDLELLFAPALFLDEGRTITRQHGVTLATVLLQPESRGEVFLARTARGLEIRIDPRYLSDPGGRDAARLEVGVRRCLEIARAAPLALDLSALVQPPPGPDDEVVESAVHRYAQTLYHPVATCAMGRSLDSVVDPELRVRGIEGLRVADASVIPRIVRGHTAAPTMVIAEVAAELVRAV